MCYGLAPLQPRVSNYSGSAHGLSQPLAVSVQVRVFTGKTFAFVNYQTLGPALLAQQTLNNQHVPAISSAPCLTIVISFAG